MEAGFGLGRIGDGLAQEKCALQPRHLRQQIPPPACRAERAPTSGSLWKLLRLLKTVVSVDVTEYHISQVEQIIGMLVAMLREARLHQPVAEL